MGPQPGRPRAQARGIRLSVWTCILCGAAHDAVPWEAEDCPRERSACSVCGATWRTLATLMTLMIGLMHPPVPVPLPGLAADWSRRGVGRSDVPPLVPALTSKLAFTNTYCHQFPHLDITRPPVDLIGQLEFIICSMCWSMFRRTRAGACRSARLPAARRLRGHHRARCRKSNQRVLPRADGLRGRCEIYRPGRPLDRRGRASDIATRPPRCTAAAGSRSHSDRFQLGTLRPGCLQQASRLCGSLHPCQNSESPRLRTRASFLRARARPVAQVKQPS
jgi:hypothetical protein